MIEKGSYFTEPFQTLYAVCQQQQLWSWMAMCDATLGYKFGLFHGLSGPLRLWPLDPKKKPTP